MAIMVFGSINMDMVVSAPRLPTPGETLAGSTFFTVGGGKGANQAVACARLGIPTRMIGAVGGDIFGKSLLEGLRGYGVDVQGVRTIENEASGVALISVGGNGENTIIIVAGANGLVRAEDIPDSTFDQAKVMLLQLEVPMGEVIAAARKAHERGITVILDPAPAYPLPTELYSLVNIMTPNESEAAALVGFPIQNEKDAARAATILRERGTENVIIKMGVRGAFLSNETTQQVYPIFTVETIDTVAAGDAFNGGLASALHDGLTIEAAMRWGMATGALSTTKRGAQPSMPDRESVMGLIT